METIGARLKKLREEKCYSMGHVEKVLSFSTGSINKWEKDKSVPGGKAIIALAKFFNVTTDYILEGTENNQLLNIHADDLKLIQKLLLLNDRQKGKIEERIDMLLDQS